MPNRSGIPTVHYPPVASPPLRVDTGLASLVLLILNYLPRALRDKQ